MNPSRRPSLAPQFLYVESQAETKAAIAAERTNVYGFYAENNNASTDVYLQIFDKLAADVTVGTTAPDYTYKIPAGGAVGRDPMLFPLRYHANGVTIAVTSTRTGALAPASPATVQFWFAPGT